MKDEKKLFSSQAEESKDAAGAVKKSEVYQATT